MRLLVPLAFSLPLLVATLLVVVNRIVPRRLADSIAIFTAAGITVICYLLFASSQVATIVYWFGGWVPRDVIAIGICFVVDPFSGAIATFIGILFTSALTISWHYFESIGTLFHALMLVFLSAMIGFCLSGDLFTLFVCFELMSVVAYALTAYKIEESSLESALNFAVTNAIAGFILLLGIGILYGKTGALNLAQVGNTLASQPLGATVVVAFMLILCGLLVKAAIVPFHFWLDDAHAVAPTPVCVIFSGIMVESALYAIARIFWTAVSTPLAPYMPELRTLLIVAGAVTSVVGAILCLAQRHIKRMLAFSTISHSGLILAGLGLLSSGGLAGAGVYLLGHGMVKGALFICAGIVLHRTTSVDEISLKGKGRHLKGVALLMALGALGLCGIPPFATFLGKAKIDDAASLYGYRWLAPLIALTSACTASAVLRMTARVFLGLGPSEEGQEAKSPTEQEAPETRGSHHKTPLSMLLPAALLIFGCVVLTYLPSSQHQSESWAATFQDRPAYSTTVLRGVASTAYQPPPAQKEKTGYAWAAMALGVAVMFTYLSLFRHSLPINLREGWAKTADPIAEALKYFHSGQVGDYVVWQVVGLMAFGIALFFATR